MIAALPIDQILAKLNNKACPSHLRPLLETELKTKQDKAAKEFLEGITNDSSLNSNNDIAFLSAPVTNVDVDFEEVDPESAAEPVETRPTKKAASKGRSATKRGANKA